MSKGESEDNQREYYYKITLKEGVSSHTKSSRNLRSLRSVNPEPRVYPVRNKNF